MNPLQMLLRFVRLLAERALLNLVSRLRGLSEDASGICLQRASLGHALFERGKNVLFETRSQFFKAHKTRVVLGGSLLDAHQKLAMSILAYFPSVFEALGADFDLVHLDFPFQLIQPFPLNHGAPDLMPQEPCRPVTLDSQLFLQIPHRHSLGRGGHHENGPEPLVQRKMALMKHRSGGRRNLLPTWATLKQSPRLNKSHRFSTPWTGVAFWPSDTHQIRPARHFIRKAFEKLENAQFAVWLFFHGHGPSLT